MGPEELKLLASMGVGGVLAYVVMKWKREDDKTYQASQAATLDKVLAVVTAVTEALKAVQIQVQTMLTVSKLEEEVRKLKEKST